ncbi:MAG: bifunctional pyr operon transcriptional regulator/uracil phosphoribosyltransferase PyrR [Roseimicrobium sp.]
MMDPTPILAKEDIARFIETLAASIRQQCTATDLALVGIHKRGVPLAERLHALLKPHYANLRIGRVDISLYRDDLRYLHTMPKLVGSDIPFDLDGMHVILVDEVLYTGRTARAALEELLEYGRPAKVEFAAMIDRGGRQLPIEPKFVGTTLDVPEGMRVSVRFVEVDGEDAVYVREGTRR